MRRLPAVNLTTGNSCVLGFALYVFTYAYVHVGNVVVERFFHYRCHVMLGFTYALFSCMWCLISRLLPTTRSSKRCSRCKLPFRL